jgi:hypothetical protein
LTVPKQPLLTRSHRSTSTSSIINDIYHSDSSTTSTSIASKVGLIQNLYLSKRCICTLRPTETTKHKMPGNSASMTEVRESNEEPNWNRYYTRRQSSTAIQGSDRSHFKFCGNVT